MTLKINNTKNSLFKKSGFYVYENAISEDTVNLLKTQFEMMMNVSAHKDGIKELNYKTITKYSDKQVPHSYPQYSHHAFESLMLVIQPKVEEVTGLTLYPCYTYARAMYEGAIMLKHRDRPSCQYSVTMCIDEDKDCEYPIYMENYAGEVNEVYLAPGDMIVYNGTELNHWRERYTGKRQIQAFLHYVDANGQYADYKFDKRPMLGIPK
jgi:hypothetical protein